MRDAIRNLNEWLLRLVSMPWPVSEDWPQTRLRATIRAKKRQQRYRRERRELFARVRRESRPHGMHVHRLH